MKRLALLAFTGCLIALTALCPAALAAQFSTGDVCFVYNPEETDRLNLRAAPRADALSLGKYYTGTGVEVTGSARNGYVPVRIAHSSVEGYMDARFLTDSAVVNGTPIVKVAGASGVNLRSEPSTDASILGTYAKGSSVQVMGVRSDDWCHVYVDGVSGFMRASLLTPRLSYHKNTQPSAGARRTLYVSNPNPSDRLNLRAAPDSEAAVLAKYFSGTQVERLDAPRNGWVRVRVSGTLTGYMQEKYLSDQPIPSAMPAKTVENASGTGLHLRKTAGTGARSLGLYRNGTQVTVMGVTGSGWAHVSVDGKTGFMLASGFDSDYGMTFAPPGEEP